MKTQFFFITDVLFAIVRYLVFGTFTTHGVV